MPVALAATIIMAVGMVRLTWEAGEWDARMDRPMQTSSLAESAAEADAARPERREREAAKPQPAATLSLPASASPTITAPARMMRMAPPSVRGEEERMSDEQRLRNILQTKPATRDEDTKRPQQQTDRSPEEWLAHIARLRQQGRIAEAQASFEEFRRRYPHYPLPIEEGTD